ADAIVRAYRPATVLDVGCGPGHLSRALAARGAQVVALDFYSKPDFREERISFHRCDLNSRDDLRTVSLAFPRLFDVAVCLEVVAHLKPEISDDIVDFLCKHARAVVFSAAVPSQGGLGQINCQPREAWHERFVRQGFQLVHRVRPNLIANSELASWFRFNIMDYSTSVHAITQHTEPVHSLLLVDSILTSEFFIQRRERDAALIRLERERDGFLASRSWRLTAPLRFLAQGLRNLVVHSKLAVAEAKRRNNALAREKAKLVQENEAQRQSRSWRLTAPLRIVVNKCRALAHQRPAMQRQRVEE